MVHDIGVRIRAFAPRILHSDLALGYAFVVLAVYAWVHAGHTDVVTAVSTNLTNLRAQPVRALFWSAFVEADPSDLLLLPVLVVVYALAQNHFGRLATLVVIVIGHVLATLSVATMLVSGLNDGRLSGTVVTAEDVGVSYGLAAVTGLLAAVVPRRFRLLYAVTALLGWSWAVIFGRATFGWTHPTFTDMGHTIAFGAGLGMAAVANARARSQAAARTDPDVT